MLIELPRVLLFAAGCAREANERRLRASVADFVMLQEDDGARAIGMSKLFSKGGVKIRVCWSLRRVCNVLKPKEKGVARDAGSVCTLRPKATTNSSSTHYSLSTIVAII